MADKPVVVLISADAEWQAVLEFFSQVEVEKSPLGDFFLKQDAAREVVYFHGGWGKISSAAAAQYVIDRWQPDVLVNLGTCGGFEAHIKASAILLVSRTLVYDIQESMGDQELALTKYDTRIDLGWLDENIRLDMENDLEIVSNLLISADRDILPADIPHLVEKFGAVAADWESASIAWVARRNGTRCLILRGVSDVVSPKGGEAYGDASLFQERARSVMNRLVTRLSAWMPDL